MKKRAWIEINMENLKHNANVIQQALPPGCKLMAVVKANAYGHGDVAVSKVLNKAGVYSFAVASLQEGILLRQQGIEGEILILGYTPTEDCRYLVEYQLMQTVVDYHYAKELDRMGSGIQVHIKIDTGMHRLGERFDHMGQIERIFQCKHLQVEAMYTHLCVSDSLEEEAVQFSRLQIQRFYQVTDHMKDLGYTFKTHIQSSYGMLNYPELECDYARIGIALYGVLSETGETKLNLNLKPVLSMRSSVIMAKTVYPGETISYGKVFTACKKMKIAIVSIGYADGFPRNVWEHRGYVLVGGKKAPIVGRICMDQMIIDITAIDNVKQGDMVTLIGQDHCEKIQCEEVAAWSMTISNELLSRLGNRLEKVLLT